MKKFWLGFLVVLLLGASCSKKNEQHAAGSALNPGFPIDLSGNRYLVQFKEDSEDPHQAPLIHNPVNQRNFLTSTGSKGTVVETLHENLHLVIYSLSSNIAGAVTKIKKENSVSFVEPDYQVRSFAAPNDPGFSQQWAHVNIQSEKAWAIGEGSPDLIVAVIDTGIDYNHPDLKNQIWKNPTETPGNNLDDDGNGLVDDVMGYDFANNDNDPLSDDAPTFHGTHVAGIIAAEGGNSVGVVGEAPKVKLMPLKFIGSDGLGYISGAVKAIDYAIAKGAKILSNSWGGPSASQTLVDAVKRAHDAGVLFIAAAGNGGPDQVGDNNDQSPIYPANIPYDNVIAVAATNQNDQLTAFSNYGPKMVHVAAPGDQIYSTKNGSAYQLLSGTSMAAPLVAGVAALVWSLKPDWNYLTVKNAIIKTSDEMPGLKGKVVSGGRVNAYRAMEFAKTGNPNPDPTPTPNPTPQPSPVPGVAQSPLIYGKTEFTVHNPYQIVSITFNVAEFVGAGGYGAFLEISRPNLAFKNPNDAYPDPYHWVYYKVASVSSSIALIPAQVLPAWGTYQIRVIPLNYFSTPVGKFSNPAILTLKP